MWDNLTLKQKAEVMKLAVQQGISDLDSIRDLYNASVNTFSVGGPKNNKKKSSGYSPSTSIKKRVTQWEGASMHSPAPDTGKVNRSFDDEARDFNAVNRSLPGFNALPQASKDALFSYSYNVGVGNYKDRVHPVLRKFLMGQATVEDVQNAMWASKDSDPRMSGLRRRRAAERNLFAEGLGQNGVAYTSDDIPEEITWENYKKRQAAQNMQFLNDRMNTINKSFTSATSTPTVIIPDLSNQPEIKDEDYLIKDTPRKNKGMGILPAIKLITQGPGALLSSLTPASSSNSLLRFLPSIKFDKGGSKINQQDLDRNNWRWATRDELQEDDPLINTLGDNDKWIVNSEGRLVPTSKVNEWLNSYERQTPYQEQNDIATAREIELKQQYRANKEFNRQMDNFWGFNWVYPSQILGAFNPAGDNRDIPFAQRLFLGTGNTGAVSHKFAEEHPYLATGINLLFDIATPGAVLESPKMLKFYGNAARKGAINAVARASFYFPQKNAAADATKYWRNLEYNNFLNSINGDNYYRLVNSRRTSYSPTQKYFLSHTTPWAEFVEPNSVPSWVKTMDDFKRFGPYDYWGENIMGNDRLYEFPHRTFGDLKSTGSNPNTQYGTSVRDLGELHLKYGDLSSGPRGEVPIYGHLPNTYESGWGLVDRPLEYPPAYPNGIYDFNPIYEQIHAGPQTVVTGDILRDALRHSSYNIYERTPNGVQRRLFLGEPKVEQASLEELEKLYDNALARGDSRLQQKIRDLHFLENSGTKLVNDAGDPQNLWHGSPNHFTEYDPSRFGTVTDEGYYGKGLYTSQDYNTAATYGRNGYMYNFYVDSKNPFKVGFYDSEFNPFSREELEIRSGIASDFNRDTKHILPWYDEESVNKLRAKLANSDAVIMSYPKGSTGFKYHEVVVPTPEQLKLADAVTFDDHGMIIPLSERDNFSIKDFRYSKGGKIKNKK